MSRALFFKKFGGEWSYRKRVLYFCFVLDFFMGMHIAIATMDGGACITESY